MIAGRRWRGTHGAMCTGREAQRMCWQQIELSGAEDVDFANDSLR